MLPPSLLFFLAGLSAFSVLAASATSETRPGTNGALETRTVIEGLLVARTYPQGYGLCGNGDCCPAGGACSTKGWRWNLGVRLRPRNGSWCYGTEGNHKVEKRRMVAITRDVARPERNVVLAEAVVLRARTAMSSMGSKAVVRMV
ncbi:hypothetical protein B0H16DRAFT_1463982, partial [Mycena metata]